MINPIYKFHIVDKGANLFNRYDPDVVAGYQIGDDGVLAPNAGAYVSGYMPISGNTWYFNTWVAASCFYDANKNPIGWGYPYTGKDGFIKSPINARYIRTTIITAQYTNQTYVFTLARLMRPVYKDDLAKEIELETNQRFYRAKLSGKISFVRDDYDYLAAKSFATEYLVYIFQSDDMGATWFEYYKGKFMKTDCEWNDDDKLCTVQPDTLDDYNDVLAGMEKEYNLITLAPKIEQLVFQKRPLIQVYIPGDSVVSCFIGGNYWEQDANQVTDRNALINTYHFALCNLLKEINVTTNGTPNVNGLYVGRMSINANNTFTGTLYPNTSNGYIIRASQVYQPPFWGVITYEIVRASDNVVLFRYQNISPGNNPIDNIDFDAAAVSDSGATGSAHCEMATYNIYVRYLLDVETISGLNTYPLPTDDIVDNNRNYRRAIGYAIDIGYISNNFSTEPTQYGRADNGLYFTPPYSIWGQTFFPIARSTWRYASIWFGFSSFDWILEEQGRKPYVLRDAYPLASCIQVLLKQFAPNITHEATTEYSQFLYGRNPINGRYLTPLISQKTNVTVGDYDQPAQKAPITLQQLTNMLRDCFRCFWYIEDGKFKIEHILFFRNGGSYSGGQQIGIDLTTLTNIRNGKKWGFNSSAWSFDKVDMPERYQFEWMDDVTQAFEGFPIDVKSKYVTAGKIEEVNISNFTSDVDYMILNPSAISNDGFGLFWAYGGATGQLYTYKQYPGYAVRPSDGEIYEFTGWSASNLVAVIPGETYIVSHLATGAWYNAAQTYISGQPAATGTRGTIVAPEGAAFYRMSIPDYAGNNFVFTSARPFLPFYQYSYNGLDYILQNGYLAMIYLQPTFYVYDLPATDVEINGESVYPYGIERKKKQTVAFPVIDDPDPLKLIKTYIGNGQIDKISINLSSRMTKTTIKYDTE